MNEPILFVDDDPNILDAYQRTLRRQFKIERALCAREGLEALKVRGPYAVVVADMQMPEMNGVEFLAEVRQIAPQTVRMMLTGNADQQTALEAVNEGQIFRFMTKPCPPENLAKALEAGVQQYRLVTSERELLGNTLRGSIKLLTDVLGLVNPAAFGRASRVRQIVGKLCRELNLERTWLIEIAAMVSQIGCVSVPEETLAKVYRQEPLSGAEAKSYEHHPQVAHDLLVNIPRLEEVAEIVARQNVRHGDSGDPGAAALAPDVLLGSRLLKVALDWDAMISTGTSSHLAMAEMLDRASWYDPTVIAALQAVIQVKVVHVIRRVNVHQLLDGVILADDVNSLNGTLLCAKGQEVTPSMRARLRNYGASIGIRSPIKVFVPATQAALYPSEVVDGPAVPLAEAGSEDAEFDRWLKHGVSVE
jgi:response regulator RpfG family c-di-GMP phosphodiesterase